MNRLGIIHADGRGVPKDKLAAYMWFSLAARSGHDQAADNRQRIANGMSREDQAAGEDMAGRWLAERDR
jgi:hypothetical protein